jgi:hypothetical protein
VSKHKSGQLPDNIVSKKKVSVFFLCQSATPAFTAAALREFLKSCDDIGGEHS